MNRESIICKCRQATRGDVLKAWEQGARKFKEVKKATGAGGKCGKCKSDIKKLLRKLKEREASPSAPEEN